MFKGVNRNVIVVKTDKDSRFETAYFVLRPHQSEDRDKSGTMTEACGLIFAGERNTTKRKGPRGVLYAILCFVVGVILGIVGTVALQGLLG